MSKLIIVTTYTFRRKILKVNRSLHVDKAVLNAVDHMQKNHYGASVAEVHNGETGELYAVITRRLNGKMDIIYNTSAILAKVYVETTSE
jgi:hypothetical protein